MMTKTEDQDIGVPDLAIKKKSRKSKMIATTTTAKASKQIAFPTMPDWMSASAATIYDCMAIGRTNNSTLKPDWVRKFENPSWGHIVPRVIKELKEMEREAHILQRVKMLNTLMDDVDCTPELKEVYKAKKLQLQLVSTLEV